MFHDPYVSLPCPVTAVDTPGDLIEACPSESGEALKVGPGGAPCTEGEDRCLPVDPDLLGSVRHQGQDLARTFGEILRVAARLVVDESSTQPLDSSGGGWHAISPWSCSCVPTEHTSSMPRTGDRWVSVPRSVPRRNRYRGTSPCACRYVSGRSPYLLEPPIGIEPMTFSLRVRRCQSADTGNAAGQHTRPCQRGCRRDTKRDTDVPKHVPRSPVSGTSRTSTSAR